MAPNVPAVMKNTRAMLSPVKCMKTEASESPISPANTQNQVWAEAALILLMRALIANTTINGANIATHISGVPKIRLLSAGVLATT